MEQKYIDEFFSSGRLMLSSFFRFSKHADEQRQDTKEGMNLLSGRGQNLTMAAVTGHGHRSIIFCTSTRGDESLMQAFNCSGYFKIKDTTKFGAAIASSLAGFQNGMEGFCIYQDERVIERDIGELSIDDLKANPADNNLSMERVFAMANKVAGPEAYFVKLRKYSEQNEYRFVWNLSVDVPEMLLITCPEAVAHCERVTPSVPQTMSVEQ